MEIISSHPPLMCKGRGGDKFDTKTSFMYWFTKGNRGEPEGGGGVGAFWCSVILCHFSLQHFDVRKIFWQRFALICIKRYKKYKIKDIWCRNRSSWFGNRSSLGSCSECGLSAISAPTLLCARCRRRSKVLTGSSQGPPHQGPLLGVPNSPSGSSQVHIRVLTGSWPHQGPYRVPSGSINIQL